MYFSSAHKNTIKKLMAQTVGTGETELKPGYVWSDLAVDRLKRKLRCGLGQAWGSTIPLCW